MKRKKRIPRYHNGQELVVVLNKNKHFLPRGTNVTVVKYNERPDDYKVRAIDDVSGRVVYQWLTQRELLPLKEIKVKFEEININ